MERWLDGTLRLNVSCELHNYSHSAYLSTQRLSGAKVKRSITCSWTTYSGLCTCTVIITLCVHRPKGENVDVKALGEYDSGKNSMPK